MTKKDFELIASILNTCRMWFTKEIIDKLSDTFADLLTEKYPRFDKEKFLKACGVQTLCKKCNTDLDSATHRWGHCDNYCLNKEHYKQVLLNGFCLKCGKRE